MVAGIAVFTAYLTLFALIQSFPFLETSMTLQGTYWMFASVCALNAVVAATLLPRTLGRTSKEISQDFL
jgi:hypothetical protein